MTSLASEFQVTSLASTESGVLCLVYYCRDLRCSAYGVPVKLVSLIACRCCDAVFGSYEYLCQGSATYRFSLLCAVRALTMIDVTLELVYECIASLRNSRLRRTLQVSTHS